MKIGFLSPFNWICGISEFLRYGIYYGLNEEERKNITVFARSDTNSIIRPDEDFVKRCWYKDNFYQFLNYALDENPVDVINIQHEYGLQDTEPLVKAIKLIQARGIKVIPTMHTTRYGEDMNKNPITSIADWTITHTETVGDRVTAITHPFFDMAIDHKASRSRFDAQCNTAGKFLVCHFGFPYPHKGHKEIIDAVKQIDAVLVLVFGKREDTDRNVPNIMNYAQSQGVPTLLIHSWLEIEQVIDIIAACDVAVFAHPKDTPGQSGAIRIGMAAKVPIVTTQANVIKDAWNCLDVCEFDNIAETIVKARGTEPRYLDYIKANTWRLMMDTYKGVFENIREE
jgi:glycosyltransferase involved in cell wall biosynthesis